MTSERKSPAPAGTGGEGKNQNSPKATISNDRLQAEIDYYESAEAWKPTATCTLPDLIEGIRSDEFAERVSAIRELIEAGKKDAADSLKKQLPAVSISGSITGRRKRALEEGRFRHSGFLQIDLDAKDHPGMTLGQMRARLLADPHIVAVFDSPSGNGVKGVARVPADPAQHLAAFLAAEAHFASLGLVMDPACKDPVRLCFVSHDPDAVLRDGIVLPIPAARPPEADHEPEEKVAEPPRPPRSSAPPPSPSTSAPRIRSARPPLDAATIADMLRHIPYPGYDGWLKITNAVWREIGITEGTRLLQQWAPEKNPGDYEKHAQHPLSDITAGTLIHIAKEHGWKKAHCETQIPEDVFPLPTPTGGIGHNQASEIIFPVLGSMKKLFLRGTGVSEIISSDGNEHLARVSPERFCCLIETAGKRIAKRETIAAADGTRREVWRTTNFTPTAAKILLESDGARKHLPPIRQLAKCPILTPDLKILSRGYHDHEGGSLITQGSAPEKIPFETAARSLRDILSDFEFATGPDASRAFASLVSPALKMGGWINDDFPLDLAEADQSQSGKTYRQKLVCRIYNETPSSITISKGGVGSIDETISAVLLKNRPFVTLGNIRGRLDSQILEEALRGAGRVNCRSLRQSAEVDCRPFMWQLSTNGAELTRDLANRSIVTRIRKRPEGHVWKSYTEGDLENHLIKNQPFFLGCVFSVISHWHAKGRPNTDESRHDFRQWCRALDAIVQMCGFPPLLDGHREQQERTSNPALQWLREVLLITRTVHHGHALFAHDLARIAEDSGIEFPGNPHSKDDPHIRAGRILGRIFREAEADEITVDGFIFRRIEEPDYSEKGSGRTIRKYIIKTPESL